MLLSGIPFVFFEHAHCQKLSIFDDMLKKQNCSKKIHTNFKKNRKNGHTRCKEVDFRKEEDFL